MRWCCDGKDLINVHITRMRPHLAVIWLLTRMRPRVYSQDARLEERPFARVAGMRRACGVSRQCACKYAFTRGATGYNMALPHTATRRPSAPMGGCMVQQATAWSVARTLINSCGARTPVDSCGARTPVDSCGARTPVDSCGARTPAANPPIDTCNSICQLIICMTTLCAIVLRNQFIRVT